ncbi:MAG TPA: alpha/beta hydrolase [Caulobacteraceae bacterium]
MPLDRHAQRLLKMLALSGPGNAVDIVRRRGGLETLCDIGEDEIDAGVQVADLTLRGAGEDIPARLYSPEGLRRPAPALVYLHGGGWVAGSLRTHDGFCRRLASASRCKLLAVDYRLAPEHPFPAGLEDALTAIRWIGEQAADLGVDPMRLGVAGDSAGGGLAAAAAQILAASDGPQIALQLLICPILDIARESASRQNFAEGYFLDRAALAADLAHYVPPGADLSDPRLSPLLAEQLEALPPALIHTAEFDPFRDEGEAYAKRLQAAGVPAQHTDHAGMIHYFYALPRPIPYAREAAQLIGEQVRTVFGASD